jgi:hypothetical protein
MHITGKAFGVILLHFEVDQGHLKNFFFFFASAGCRPAWAEPCDDDFRIWIFGPPIFLPQIMMFCPTSILRQQFRGLLYNVLYVNLFDQKYCDCVGLFTLFHPVFSDAMSFYGEVGNRV